jgi:hypothetical protein
VDLFHGLSPSKGKAVGMTNVRAARPIVNIDSLRRSVAAARRSGDQGLYALRKNSRCRVNPDINRRVRLTNVVPPLLTPAAACWPG